MKGSLQGQLALITGASSGIGAAVACALAAQGARLILIARSVAGLEGVAGEIRARGGEAFVYALDLSAVESIAPAVEAIMAQVGLPDLLINNAGAGRWLGIEETTPQDAFAMTAIPYAGALALTAAFAPALLARGSGHIINVTSPAAFTPFRGAVAYSVARGAMRLLTDALRADLRGTGVETTLVVLGEVESPYFLHNPGSRERLPRVARLLPILATQQAAGVIVRAAQGRPRRLVAPPLLRAILWLWMVAPRMVQWVIESTGYRRR